LGGGSSVFLLRPQTAILGDLNSDLIDLYEVVRDHPRKIARMLKYYQRKHSEKFFYKTRESKPSSKLKKAAWLLYLIRTCWNGLFRVNLKGEFNVPIGSKTKVFVSDDEFIEPSRILKASRLFHSDFVAIIAKARKGDVVFADPPYFDIKKKQDRFLKYNENVFCWDDQLRLRDALLEARRRGARCYVTNANHKSLVDIYCHYGVIRVLNRQSVLAGPAWARRRSKEILVEVC